MRRRYHFHAFMRCNRIQKLETIQKTKVESKFHVLHERENHDMFQEEKMNGPRNKHEFYTRWLRGEFGNIPPSWKNKDELAESGYKGLLSVRSMTPGARMETQVTVHEALSKRWPSDVVFQAIMPDEDLVLQGSLSYDHCGLTLEYCMEPCINFRQAMNQAQNVNG